MNAFRLAGLVLIGLFLCRPAPVRAAAFLFDATKAESAGNANWVIDEDSNVAGRYPTPAASGITATTAETYWTGALSSWGVALVQMGHSVEQLPVGGRITYLDSTNAQDLSKYQVYVVCEPNILFTAAEKNALVRYVQGGGSLFVISDHSGSDRNNDGYDSVAIWNDFFASNGVVANPFGVAVNTVSTSLTSTYVDTAADDPLSNGALGPVSQLKYSSGATLTISTAANLSVRAAFWSTAAHTNSTVMAAYGSFGAGRFVVTGDSSPPDDGTGSAGHTLYPGWTELGVNHSRLYLNASVWLAAANSSVPYNDNFANAALLGPAATNATGANIGATKESGEPLHADNAGGASVWWQFTAANGGTATITTAGSDFDTLLAVYTGTTVNALTRVAANDNVSASVLQSSVSFPVTAGTTYRVAVDGANGATGHVVLNPTLPGPANDAFANATTFAYSGTALTLTGNNYNATSETGEPAHANVAGGRSVWWRWTATASGPVAISLLNSDFDTSLAVYTGTAVNALTVVASNANYGSSLQSYLNLNAVAGTTYRIAVDGNAGAMGNVRLDLSPGTVTTPPANDNFANATPISGTNLTTSTVATTYATKETGEPNHGGISGGHSVWWRWNAPSDGTVTISTTGSNYDTTLGVYTGATVATLTTLAGDDDSGGGATSKVVLNVTADTTYLVAVDGYGSGSVGNALLNLSFVASALPANDNFANAAALTGTSASGSAVNTSATKETGEPDPYNTGRTIWWRWTAPSNLYVTLSTVGSSFSPTLAVYTGAAVNALTSVANASGSSLSFQAQSGVTYSIQVAGGIGSPPTGTVALGLTSQTLPTVSLTANPAQISERGSTVGVFTVAFDAPVAAAVNVSVILSGTADSIDDYTSSPPSILGRVIVTVPANQTSAPLTITPTDDNYPTEGTESIIATVLTGTNYQVSGQAATATISLLDDSPYNSAWISLYHFTNYAPTATAPAADFDGDGVPNLLEFAFNRNPLAADAPSTLPSMGSGLFVDPDDPAGATHRYATLTFIRRTDAPNLTYSVEATDDPAAGTWSASGATLLSASAAGMAANTEQATYRATAPMDGPKMAKQQFLRVRISAVNP